MIKSDAQRDRTVAQIEGFRRALAKAAVEEPSKRSAAIRGSYESMIRQLEDELREYDQMKSGELTLPHFERLDQIAPSIVKIRIAKGSCRNSSTRLVSVMRSVVSTMMRLWVGRWVGYLCARTRNLLKESWESKLL